MRISKEMTTLATREITKNTKAFINKSGDILSVVYSQCEDEKFDVEIYINRTFVSKTMVGSILQLGNIIELCNEFFQKK